MAQKVVPSGPLAGVAFLVADRRATRWRFIEMGRPADVIRIRSRREPPPLPAISRREPAAGRRRRAGPRRNDPAKDGGARPPDVVAAAIRSSYPDAERS